MRLLGLDPGLQRTGWGIAISKLSPFETTFHISSSMAQRRIFIFSFQKG
jgi:Holliday junction resolvasome RuvABC endonuclease subunit